MRTYAVCCIECYVREDEFRLIKAGYIRIVR